MVIETKLTPVYGWWDWDAETPALVNRITGERVVFRGRFEDWDLVPSGETWLRFDYLHPELTFPLLVREHEEQIRHDPRRFMHAEDTGKTIWRIDYNRSNDLWRQASGGRTLETFFGAWRRVDDCVTDAFACWPDLESGGKAWATGVWFDGGWLNGAWNRTWSRRESRLNLSAKHQPEICDFVPWLVPLDALPPSPFRFHDDVWTSESENRDIENPVLLDGLIFEERFTPAPASDPVLSSVRGRAAYLLSDDGNRIFYPYFGDSTKPEGEAGRFWAPLFSLFYADDDFFATATGAPFNGIHACSDWHISPVSRGYAIRTAVAETPLTVTSRQGLPWSPSRALCLRIHWAVMDGWSCWKGTQARSSKWSSGLKLAAASGVSIGDGYRGGQWTASSTEARF